MIYARRVYVLVLHQSRTTTIIQPTKTTITTLRDISLRSCVLTGEWQKEAQEQARQARQIQIEAIVKAQEQARQARQAQLEAQCQEIQQQEQAHQALFLAQVKARNQSWWPSETQDQASSQSQSWW